MNHRDSKVTFAHESRVLPAFDLIGFTKIVPSGGELYEEVRNDGRWEVLKELGGPDKTIYGVAAFAKGAPKDHYRYTLAVKRPSDYTRSQPLSTDLFPIHIGESQWVVFSIDHFASQYGAFWEENPYQMIKKLGYDFNKALSLHIDVFPPSYDSDEDAMEFMMPVKSHPKS